MIAQDYFLLAEDDGEPNAGVRPPVTRTTSPFGNGRAFLTRGSKARVRRLRARDHLGWWGLAFALWVLFLLLVAVPYFGQLPHR